MNGYAMAGNEETSGKNAKGKVIKSKYFKISQALAYVRELLKRSANGASL